jgi:hypothetical protein
MAPAAAVKIRRKNAGFMVVIFSSPLLQDLFAPLGEEHPSAAFSETSTRQQSRELASCPTRCARRNVQIAGVGNGTAFPDPGFGARLRTL